ncbi:MAG: hypothetical protein IKV85_10400 [Ruminococcus sp.]|nr:hypothetical protein [Ruminococcus sp.]
MKILEIIQDILDDFHHTSDSCTDIYTNMGSTPWEARNNGGDLGCLAVLFPNILGFLFGLAITKMFGMGGAAYFVFGFLGGVGLGVLNSVYRQGIALKYAIIRHIILVIFMIIPFTIYYVALI